MPAMPRFRALRQKSLLQVFERNLLIADLAARPVGQDRGRAVVGQILAANRGDRLRAETKTGATLNVSAPSSKD